MPSRQPELPPPAPPHHHHHSHHQNLIAPLIASGGCFCLLLLVAFLYRKLTRSRTAPAPLSTPEVVAKKELRKFEFSVMKKATASFAARNRLGQGGFGSVYRAVVPGTAEVYAVKLMEVTGSIQGEREFHNEIALASRVLSTVGSPYLVSIIGYATVDRRRKVEEERKLIVYEFMPNGSLQEKLLDSKCSELCVWDKRFKIIGDVAKALRFLHIECGNTAVVHGDVKPSNVLLDCEFNAKLGDFGLARILDECDCEKYEENQVLLEVVDDCCNEVKIEEENEIGSIVEDESVSLSVSVSGVTTVERSPVTEVALSPSDGFERASSLPESWVDKMSVESGKIGKKSGKVWGSGRDYWWWKQGEESGRVKDYVMDWIGSEIKKERPKSSDLVAGCVNSKVNSINCDDHSNVGGGKIEEGQKRVKKGMKKRLDRWWTSLDDEEEKLRKKREKSRKPREWWREEFCDELCKKKNKKSKSSVGTELWWQRDEDFVAPERKKRRKSKSSFGSIDWWLDGLSGELRGGGNGGGRRNSQDWGGVNGEVPKSGGISSTPSMRGTVCYIAPEYGGGGQLSEKCDVYSFGVLVLVIISGRRPLQVLASPMSEFERANLVSWARQLAYNGKLLDLVDTTIESLDREQAMLCITIALSCLQRSPLKRPNMKEIVEMLTGEAEPPHLPFEFSPSPPSNFPFKSRKKGRRKSSSGKVKCSYVNGPSS